MSAAFYVSNHPPSAAEEVLAGIFGQLGTVLSVKLRDPASRVRSARGAGLTAS